VFYGWRAVDLGGIASIGRVRKDLQAVVDRRLASFLENSLVPSSAPDVSKRLHGSSWSRRQYLSGHPGFRGPGNSPLAQPGRVRPRRRRIYLVRSTLL
jgi:hypothetical protein